jgi:hypothetical protein
VGRTTWALAHRPLVIASPDAEPPRRVCRRVRARCAWGPLRIASRVQVETRETRSGMDKKTSESSSCVRLSHPDTCWRRHGRSHKPTACTQFLSAPAHVTRCLYCKPPDGDCPFGTAASCVEERASKCPEGRWMGHVGLTHLRMASLCFSDHPLQTPHAVFVFTIPCPLSLSPRRPLHHNLPAVPPRPQHPSPVPLHSRPCSPPSAIPCLGRRLRPNNADHSFGFVSFGPYSWALAHM